MPPTYQWRREDYNRTARLEEFLPWFKDWKFDWLDVPGLIRNCPHAYEYPLVDRDPIAQWTFGRVTLMGDAAHPMYPIGSNGASQAILDARVLTREILAHGPTNAALMAYEAERRPATTDLVMLNRRNGPEQVMQLVEERAPDGYDVVTDVLSQQELEDIAANYKRVAGFQVEGLNAKPPIVAKPALSASFRGSAHPSPCAITLRMTLGSASSFSVAIGTQRMPSGARLRGGNARGVDHKLERKMREDMGDDADLAMPARDAFQAWAPASVPPCRPARRASPSSALRSCRRAGLFRDGCEPAVRRRA